MTSGSRRLFSKRMLSGDNEGGEHVEPDVVYGMVSGLALLLDVHRPQEPNGHGIVFVCGCGWRTLLSLDASPLKESQPFKVLGIPLVEAGYTVFSVNHRATPRFKYPAAVEDVQRAVRFVRHHASEYAIDPERIGAAGGSSGGHLVSMLGVLDGHGNLDDASPIDRESARVQCVVAWAAPADMLLMQHRGAAVSFLGVVAAPDADPNSIERKRVEEASPISHVSPDAPPFLLIHGDADPVVPFEQTEMMVEALKGAGVEVELLRVPGGGHGPTFGGVADPPDYIGAMIGWFDQHLRAT